MNRIKIGEKIRERRLELNMTQAEVSRLSGVDASLLSRIEKGERRLNEPDLWKISGALGWSPERLFSSESNVADAKADYRRIPVLDYVQAGQWMEVREKLSDEDLAETVGINMDYPPSVFALRIRGDSMAPEFKQDDLVIIAPTIIPKPGDCVVAVDENGEATFKKYRQVTADSSGRAIFELVPLNPDYGVIRSDMQKIAIVGTMIEHRKYRVR